jgi:hypothetical protein
MHKSPDNPNTTDKALNAVSSVQDDVRHYLVYWRPKNVETRLARHPLLNYAGSNQFRHINPDDVLWFVTVRDGKLFLVGRLVVGERTNWDSALERLGKLTEKSRFIVIAKPGSEDVMLDMPLEHITEDIRFDSPSNDRFTLANRKLNPQQMQMKRLLTVSSSRLINAQWESSRFGSTNKQDT